MFTHLYLIFAQLDPVTKTNEWNAWATAVKGSLFGLVVAGLFIYVLVTRRVIGAIFWTIILVALAYKGMTDPGFGSGIVDAIF